MGALGLVSVLISHVCDGELLAGLLIHPGEGSVDDSGLVVSASVLEDTLLFDAGAIAGLHVGAPLLGLNIGDLPHDLGKVGAGLAAPTVEVLRSDSNVGIDNYSYA